MLILIPCVVYRSPLSSNVSYPVSLLNHENKHLPSSKNLLNAELNGVTGKDWLGRSGRRGRSSGSYIDNCTGRQYAWGFGTSMSVRHLATIYFSKHTTRQLLRIKKDSASFFTPFFPQTSELIATQVQVRRLPDIL